MNQQLIGHLLGALDDDEQQWLEARLEHDEERRRALVAWRRRLAPLDALRPDFEPPAGLAERTCRLVAAFGPPPARTPSPVMAMSPAPVSSGYVPQFGWADVTAIGAVLMLALFLLLPAINGSRFYARVASCQDGMRQFGLALADHGSRQRAILPRLAAHGQLTEAGMLAAVQLREQFGPNAGAGLCADCWLASQGGEPNASFFRPSRGVAFPGPARLTPADVTASPRPLSRPTDDLVGDWAGTWRDGTQRGIGHEPPIAEALLADAPSAMLPDQSVEYHGGLGRNLFYADGHVAFVSNKTEPSQATDRPTGGFGSPTPIIFVGGR
ncbi:MAG: hypothetical protein ABFC96_09465 [Thermoguttaceae bacterium]